MEKVLLETIKKKANVVISEDYDETEGVSFVIVHSSVDHLGVRASVLKVLTKPCTPNHSGIWPKLLNEWLRAYALFILEKNQSESTSSASTFVKPE